LFCSFHNARYWGEWKFGWGTNEEAASMLLAMVSGVAGSVAAPRLFGACGLGHRFTGLIACLGLLSAAGLKKHRHTIGK
jgi:hypothetical protein